MFLNNFMKYKTIRLISIVKTHINNYIVKPRFLLSCKKRVWVVIIQQKTNFLDKFSFHNESIDLEHFSNNFIFKLIKIRNWKISIHFFLPKQQLNILNWNYNFEFKLNSTYEKLNEWNLKYNGVNWIIFSFDT